MEDFEKYEAYMKRRPHVVILGAGASCAALPHGDKYGKKISAMNGFIDSLGLSEVLNTIEIHTDSNNLEDIYMELDERSFDEVSCANAKDELERRIYDYMSEYTIPDNPTAYDFLILSLTSKDLIATFNWDPLLIQSYCRVMKYTDNLPELAFLHGNVAVGFCEEDNVIGNVGRTCKCGNLLRPIKLLYPVKKKDYTGDIAIAKSWKTLQNALEKAYMVTIFGYSAPKSDVEAIAMLKKAWGDVEKRNLEEIEIIDIRPEDEVVESWTEFIHTHHYSCHSNLFDASLGKLPRRTCEATFDRLMKCTFLDGNKGFKPDMSFETIQTMLKDLFEGEILSELSEEILKHPYK